MPPLRLALLAAAALAALAGGKSGAVRVPRDQPTIQAAIDAAAPGTVIEVGAGVWHEALVVATPGLTLVGKRAVIDAGYAGPCVSVAADDVVVRGFVLRNGTTGVTAVGDRVALERNTVLAPAGDGLRVTGEAARLLGNEVRGAGADGLVVRGPTLEFGVTGEPPAAVEGNRVSGSAGDGLDVADVSLSIRRNTATGNGGHGLRVSPGNPFVPGAPLPRVSLNTATGNAGDGLWLESYFGPGAVIDGNRASGNAGHGLEAIGFHLVLQGNEATANGRAGLCHAGQDADLLDNRCRGNAGPGIRSEGFVAGQDAGGLDPSIRIADNDCRGNGRDGIAAAGGRFQLVGNTCDGNLGDGIDLDLLAPGGDGDPSPESSTVEDNRCRGNNHDGIDNSAQDTVLRDNVATGNAGLDLAGAGEGTGTVTVFDGNAFLTGGATALQALDL